MSTSYPLTSFESRSMLDRSKAAQDVAMMGTRLLTTGPYASRRTTFAALPAVLLSLRRASRRVRFFRVTISCLPSCAAKAGGSVCRRSGGLVPSELDALQGDCCSKRDVRASLDDMPHQTDRPTDASRGVARRTFRRVNKRMPSSQYLAGWKDVSRHTRRTTPETQCLG